MTPSKKPRKPTAAEKRLGRIEKSLATDANDRQLRLTRGICSGCGCRIARTETICGECICEDDGY